MNGRHRDVHPLLAALGHASRFRIALCLLEGERCVGDLAVAIGLSQSCTTRHVQALERAGVVRSRREGKRVLVGIEEGRAAVVELLEWIAPGSTAARASSGRGARPADARAVRSRPELVAGARGRMRARVARGPASRSAASPAPGDPIPTPRDADASAPVERDAAGRRPAEASGEAHAEPTPATPPTSGTHAALEPPASPPPRRPRETLEDFLL